MSVWPPTPTKRAPTLAEHVALQSRLVQQLVAVRQREMDYMLARYQSIGTQAALICGFSISSLTGLAASSDIVSPIVSHLFYITTFVCILSLLHVILTTLFVCNWAPGLALRGPTGSVSRAFDATRGERLTVNVCFCLGLFSFGVQTVLAVWILDQDRKPTSHSIIATCLMGTASVLSLGYLMRMDKRFFGLFVSDNLRMATFQSHRQSEVGEPTDARPSRGLPSLGQPANVQATDLDVNDTANGAVPTRLSSRISWAPNLKRPFVANCPSTPTGGESSFADASSSPRPATQHSSGIRRKENEVIDMPLLDNPSTLIQSHPDVIGSADQGNSVSGMRMTASEFEMQGTLFKQSHSTGTNAAHPAVKWWRAVESVITAEWLERYFVLRAGQLQYWRTEADYMQGKEGSEMINLDGYEVLVDMSSPFWSFHLQPTNDLSGRRTWCLRAPSEQLRLEWSRRLVISTILTSH